MAVGDEFRYVLRERAVAMEHHLNRLLGDHADALGYHLFRLLPLAEPGRGLFNHERKLSPQRINDHSAHDAREYLEPGANTYQWIPLKRLIDDYHRAFSQ